jgi:hypothetical protein
MGDGVPGKDRNRHARHRYKHRQDQQLTCQWACKRPRRGPRRTSRRPPPSINAKPGRSPRNQSSTPAHLPPPARRAPSRQLDRPTSLPTNQGLPESRSITSRPTPPPPRTRAARPTKQSASDLGITAAVTHHTPQSPLHRAATHHYGIDSSQAESRRTT